MASDNKIHKDNISATPTGIPLNSGAQKLTNSNLANESEIERGLSNVPHYTEVDDFLSILTEMETDILALFKKSFIKPLPPETMFVELFKNLNEILLQKPHYITLLFDERLMATNREIEETLIRISDVAEDHLVSLIEAGKNSGVFINGQPSKSLAGSIMKSFRSMMKDEHRINVMLLKLKSPETLIN